MSATADAIVVGGGLVGSAIAYGLTRRGLKPLLLDEGDVAYRASRGNFGLVWVQSKGDGCPAYQRWTRTSSEDWAAFAAALADETGADCGHERPGGLAFCLSGDEFDERRALMERMRNGTPDIGFDYRMLDRGEVRELVPAIGPDVVGASWTPYDGHANPLYTLRALHAAFRRRGGRHVGGVTVDAIQARPNAFTVETGQGRFSAPRIVLAAGLGNAALAPLVGLDVPVRPLRGHIIVTERVKPVLRMPTLMIRQTVEGSIMIGESREEAGFDDRSAPDVPLVLADRAVRTFPFLRNVGVVRTWAALRVMAPDGLPVYEQSQRFPGAFSATCHSGVTLAAAHALHYAGYVADGALPEALSPFTSGRFDVQKAA